MDDYFETSNDYRKWFNNEYSIYNYNNFNLRSPDYNEFFQINKTKDLSIKFYDKIIKNIYASDDYTNYIKILKFPINFQGKSSYIIVGFKFSNDELINLFNRAERNLTVIYSRETYSSIYSDFGIIPCQDYFSYFYKYSFGFDSQLFNSAEPNKIAYSLDESVKINFWNSFNMNNILSSIFNIKSNNNTSSYNDVELFASNEGINFNWNFLREVLYLGFFITTGVKRNFNESFGNNIVNSIQRRDNETFKNSLLENVINSLNTQFCRLNLPEYQLEFDFCSYLLHNNTLGIEFADVHYKAMNITMVKDTINDEKLDEYTKEIKFLKYFNVFQFNYKIFFSNYDDSDITSSVANKSFWIYVSFINGLKTLFFEMINFESYISLKDTFVNKIKDNFSLFIIVMMIPSAVNFFFFSQVSMNFVNYSKKRLDSIIFMRNNLFYNELSLTYLTNMNIFIDSVIYLEIINFIKDCEEKVIARIDICNLPESDVNFLKRNIFLSVKYRRKFKKIVHAVINGIY